MSAIVTAFPGAFLSDTREAAPPSSARTVDVAEPSTFGVAGPRLSRPNGSPEFGPPDEEKYPRWAVTLFVVLFCGAFWTGVIWLALGFFH